MKRQSKRWWMKAQIGVFVVALSQSGCATMLKGTNEQIMVTSDPSGANVNVNGQGEGTTPYVANVPSKQNLEIEVSKPGYQPTTVADNTSFRWGYEIWSFVEFVIPLGVDMADGAAWGHDQKMVAAHLNPVSQAPVALQPQTGTSSEPIPAAQPSAAE